MVAIVNTLTTVRVFVGLSATIMSISTIERVGGLHYEISRVTTTIITVIRTVERVSGLIST